MRGGCGSAFVRGRMLIWFSGGAARGVVIGAFVVVVGRFVFFASRGRGLCLTLRASRTRTRA